MGEITLRNLTKEFGDVVAVDGLSLDVADGEFLVLVGPSGCGKSTTLRMIAGLESETAGDIHIAGDHMNYRVPQHRDIAMVFQDYALYPHMTVRGNLGFGLESEPGYTDAERHERVEEIAEMLGIAPLLDRKPGELSGGQQQRVALGRAIVRDPEVFLMDEPLSNLDAKLRAEMRTELQQLQDRFGVTTVYVTHNQTEAMTMGDRIAVMNDGELQQVGEPLELYHAPANQFVAGFIGEPMMNFTHGQVREGTFVGDYVEYPFDDEIASAVEDGRREAAAVAADGAGSAETDGDDAGATDGDDAGAIDGDGDEAVDAGVVLGVRPEDIRLEAGGSGMPRDPHAFSMTVGVVEPHGNQNVVHLRHPGDEAGDELLKAVTAGTLLLEPGESVTAAIDPDAIHVFDGATGRALHNRRRETAPEVVR